MSGDSKVPPDLDPVHGRTDDPLSADRRVLVVGAIAMVALILVGVVSAALFTRSACGRIVPDPVLPRAGGADVESVIDEALPDLFDDERSVLVEFLTGTDLGQRVGEVVAAVDVTGAERLVPATDGLVAATGTTTTLFEPGSGAVRATTSVGDGAVVGDGDTLYSLALTNPGTGQTDALVALDRALEGGDCLDTATVGTPFAFLLGAGAGELLLFRVEEDGETPEVELRDAERGEIWATPLQTPQIPPGVSGERLDAAMDADTVVVGRRFVADDEAPVLSGFDRATGEERWTTPVAAFDEIAPPGDGPVWVEVLAVDGDTALLGLARDDADDDARDDARDAAHLVAVDTADGAIRWISDADPVAPLAASIGGDAVTVVGMGGAGLEVVRLAVGDGSPIGAAASPVADTEQPPVRGGIAELPGGTLAVAGSGAVHLSADEVAAFGFDPAVAAQIVDVVAVGDVTVLLIVSGDGAVGVSFRAS